MKNTLGTRLYYSISEVAELTDLQPYTLRAWEKEFSCLRPRRARGKNRAYRERDIGIIQLIKQLLYEEGYTTKGVKQKLKNEPELLQNMMFELPSLNDSVIAEEGEGPKEKKEANEEKHEPQKQGIEFSKSLPVASLATPGVKDVEKQDVQLVLREVKAELRALLEML